MDDRFDMYREMGVFDSDFAAENPEFGTKKSGFVGKLVALLLGVIIGFGACVGTVFAMLNYTSVGYGIDMLSGFTGMTFDDAVEDKLIAEKYGDKSLLQLLSDAAIAANSDSLAELNEVFPILGEYVGSLTNNAKEEFGVALERDKLLSTPLNELTSYVGDTVKTTPIASMLEASSTSGSLDPLLLEICYGEEGETYIYNENGEIETIGDNEPLTILQLSNSPKKAFERVSVAAVTHPSLNDSVMLSLAYGQENVTYEIVTGESGKKEVQMLPFFLTQDEEGNYLDYVGLPLVGVTEPAENGFVKVTQYKKDSNGNPIKENGQPVVKATYYIKDDGTGHFRGYKQPVDGEEAILFKKTLISDLQDDSMAVIDNILLKDALGIKFKDGEEDPHNILLSLAYGHEDIDYKIVGTGANREIVMIGDAKPNTIGELRTRGNDLINDLFLSDIMQEDREDFITMYLLYGKEGVHYEFAPVLDELGNPVLDDLGNPVTEVSMLHRYIYIADDGKVYNEYGELYQARTETLKGYILDTTAKTFIDAYDNEFSYQPTSPAETDIMDDGATATKCYLFNEDGEVKFARTSLGDMAKDDDPVSKITTHLTIGEILGEDELQNNTFLKHLGDKNIEELPDAINSLTVMQVFEDEIYKKDADGNFLDANGNVTTDPAKYVMDGMWEFMLKDNTGTIREDYTVANDMGNMMTNIKYNVDNSSLRDLDKKEILDFDDSMLDQSIETNIKGVDVGYTTTKTSVGDLTTNEMLEYLSALMATIQIVNGTP